MFGHRYFGRRHYGPRYFGPAVAGPTPPATGLVRSTQFISDMGVFGMR